MMAIPTLFISTLDHHRFYLYINQGSGQFAEEAIERGTALEVEDPLHRGYSIAVGDYDKDLYPDFYVTSIFDNPGLPQPPGYTGNRLYRNNPNSSVFDELSSQLEIRNGGFGWGTAFFDADNDADLDLIATNGIFTYGPELPEPTRFWINQNAAFQEASEGFGITD
ncbi:MAG: VCBS repeat-containing protein, partial [Verrucomicrobiota bacterium]